MTTNPTLVNLVGDLSDAVGALEDELIAFRRDLHAHPELSRAEIRTTARVADRLAAAGITTRLLPGSGLLADLGAEQASFRVALRADLDALPVLERTGLAWASTVPDVCHACGHDVHTTAVLGAALALKTRERVLRELRRGRPADLPAGRGGHPRRRARGDRGRRARGRRRLLRDPLRPGPRRRQGRAARGPHHRRVRLGDRAARWPRRPHLPPPPDRGPGVRPRQGRDRGPRGPLAPPRPARRRRPRLGCRRGRPGEQRHPLDRRGPGTLRMLDVNAWQRCRPAPRRDRRQGRRALRRERGRRPDPWRAARGQPPGRDQGARPRRRWPSAPPRDDPAVARRRGLRLVPEQQFPVRWPGSGPGRPAGTPSTCTRATSSSTSTRSPAARGCSPRSSPTIIKAQAA